MVLKPRSRHGGDGIQAGAVAWVTLTVKPGRYGLVYSPVDHYANGMHQELLVNSPDRPGPGVPWLGPVRGCTRPVPSM